MSQNRNIHTADNYMSLGDTLLHHIERGQCVPSLWACRKQAAVYFYLMSDNPADPAAVAYYNLVTKLLVAPSVPRTANSDYA